MILLVDNYDSFTYNLRHFLGNREVVVMRNDEADLEKVAERAQAIVFSPGPGTPDQAGQMENLIQTFKETKPMLGICLGHQAIGEVFETPVIPAKEIMHGKTDLLTHDGRGLFKNLPSEVEVMRYHSLMLDSETLGSQLTVTAHCGDTIMGIKHRYYPIYGLQFHPESIGTNCGQQIINNFLTSLEDGLLS